MSIFGLQKKCTIQTLSEGQGVVSIFWWEKSAQSRLFENVLGFISRILSLFCHPGFRYNFFGRKRRRPNSKTSIYLSFFLRGSVSLQAVNHSNCQLHPILHLQKRSGLFQFLSWVSWKSLARDHSSYPRVLIFGHVVIEWIASNLYYEQYLIDPLIWPQEGPKFAHVGPYYQAAL